MVLIAVMELLIVAKQLLLIPIYLHHLMQWFVVAELFKFSKIQLRHIRYLLMELVVLIMLYKFLEIVKLDYMVVIIYQIKAILYFLLLLLLLHLCFFMSILILVDLCVCILNIIMVFG